MKSPVCGWGGVGGEESFHSGFSVSTLEVGEASGALFSQNQRRLFQNSCPCCLASCSNTSLYINKSHFTHGFFFATAVFFFFFLALPSTGLTHLWVFPAADTEETAQAGEKGSFSIQCVNGRENVFFLCVCALERERVGENKRHGAVEHGFQTSNMSCCHDMRSPTPQQFFFRCQ